MPRETFDSILEEASLTQESLIHEEALNEIPLITEDEDTDPSFELNIDEMDYGVTVDLSEWFVFSIYDFNNLDRGTESFDDLKVYLEEEYDILESHHGNLLNGDCSFFCELSEERHHNDVSRCVINHRGDTVTVHEDCDDLIWCADTEEYYIDGDAADNNDVNYCDGCEEYRSTDQHNFDDCANEGEYSSTTFNNSECASKNQKMSKYARDRGVMSTTFANTNGMKYTFGVEIETSGGYVPEDVWSDANLNVSAVNDGSISGKEYVTGVLVGDSGLSMLNKICDAVQDSCSISSSCGIHVHIGGAIFNRRFTIMATHLGLMLQDEVFSMMPSSRKTSTYCKPIPTKHSSMTFKNYKEHLADLIYSSATLDRNNNKKTRLGRYPSKRYTWLNMVGYSQTNGHNTIEFRNHGASMNYEKIRNWTLICMAFVHFVENNQRRIWEARSLPGGIALSEVLHSALGDNLGGQVSRYVSSRKDKFNGAI